MVEWNVYVDGKYVGTVFAASEDEARCAGWAHFDPPEDAANSVAKR